METRGTGNDLRESSPLVSIVIPTYNRPTLLAEAIGNALGQTGFDDFEVLVLDNEDAPRNPDPTEAVIAGFRDSRLRYHRNPKNLGMTGNWNRGLELARGTWVSLLHDDDLICPAFLARVVPLFPSADLIVSRVVVGPTPPGPGAWDTSLRPRPARRLDRIDLAFSNPSPAPGIIFRRQLALQLGGFNEDWYPCADYDFWIRYVSEFKALLLPERLAFYRIQDNESLRPTTRIRIAEKAGLLQQALVDRLIPGSRLSRFIGSSGVISLLHHYSQDPRFRDDPEVAEFAQRQGYRPGTPDWRIKARAKLAKCLLQWRAKEGR